MDKPARWYRQIINDSSLIRFIGYIIIGCGTTLISFGTFWILDCRRIINPHAANVIAVACAVVFAYIANKKFVFRSRCSNTFALIGEIWRFLISRGLSMLTEICGLFLLHDIFKFGALVSKAAVSVIALLLNYLFFRYVVFR